MSRNSNPAQRGLPTTWGAAVAVLSLLLMVAGALVSPAEATNAGSQSGDNSTGCTVNWHARTVMDLDLNNTQDGGGLATDLVTGNPVDYSNGGYIYEVRPEYADPGMFEITHWYSNTANPAQAGTLAMWRVPLSTDHALVNGSVTFTPPAEFGPGTPSVSYINYANWKGTYATYTWGALPADAVTRNADGSFTIKVGQLANKSGTGFVISQPVPAGFDLTTPVYADATFTATYAQGATGCGITRPPAPSLDERPCYLELAGQTVFPLTAPDITVRDKYGADGEVNADGWGGGTTTRTLRIYGAVDKAATNLTFTATAEQGFSFDPASVSAIVTAANRGMGALWGNGYQAAVVGAGTPQVSADGKTITLKVDSMPAKSAFAFTVTAVLDGSGKAIVVNETLNSPQPICAPSLVLKKVDASGALLPGADFTLSYWTRWDNDIAWSGTDITQDYPIVADLTRTGQSRDVLAEVPWRGGWSDPIQQCLVVAEKAAPQGYVARTAPAVLCLGPGGWTVDNAKAAEFDAPVNGAATQTPGLGQWSVVNDQVTFTTTLTLANERVAADPTPSQSPSQSPSPSVTPSVPTVEVTSVPTPTLTPTPSAEAVSSVIPTGGAGAASITPAPTPTASPTAKTSTKAATGTKGGNGAATGTDHESGSKGSKGSKGAAPHADVLPSTGAPDYTLALSGSALLLLLGFGLALVARRRS